jgi:hypothetical protein
VSFSCTPGDYTVTFEVCDADESCDTDSRVVTVLPPPAPPVATIVEPAGNVSIAQGASVQFAGDASDPDGDLPLVPSWTFPACASPSTSDELSPGAVVFNCAPADYIVTFEVCDADEMCDTDTVVVTVLSPCQNLSQAGWSLRFVDSQELNGENGAAVNAFDGFEGTIWHTQWQGATPPHPHRIEIDLGATRTLCGFSYLPRQDGGVNGTIKGYEFAVSLDGSTWTTVASGELVPDAGNLSERTVPFAATQARHVRLRSLSAVNNGPWASAAEIRVKSHP